MANAELTRQDLPKTEAEPSRAQDGDALALALQRLMEAELRLADLRR